MKYDISKTSAPTMPNLGKGTEFCKLLLSQASKDMCEPLVSMIFPALAAHLTDVKFMYSNNKYYELCDQMGHLIGLSGTFATALQQLPEAPVAKTARFCSKPS